VSQPWIVSARVDGLAILLPATLALAVAFAWPHAALSPVGFLLLVVAVDVAHVWATLFRTYLDPVARAERRRELVVVPLACFAIAAAVATLGDAVFWRAMAYLAAYHFVRQQAGFAMLYRLREGLPTRDRSARLERWAHYAVTGWPLLWWHGYLPRRFDWFVAGDFVGIPPWVSTVAAVPALAVVAAHVGVRVRSRRWSPGRDAWLLLTAASWIGGIVVLNGDFAFTASNVVLHGVPYAVLVGFVAKRQRPGLGAGGLLAGAALLLALALVEEGLWDALVWADHPMLFGAWDPPAWATALAVPLLSVPQLTHYVLDGRIWKVGRDPRLRAVFEG
jgi:hypothetical protein